MYNNLTKQFEYEEWANNIICSALEKISGVERPLLLLSHILSVHTNWLHRIKGEEMSCTLFQVRTLHECAELIPENTRRWKEYLSSVTSEELDRDIHFVSSLDGSKRIMSVGDAITQILGHSSYHRGQIVAQMKGKIDPLPATTYIMFASRLE